MSLPDPDPSAVAHSCTLAGRIHAAIAAHGGWIRFDRFMQFALYEPGLGYYSSAGRKFGPQGDFVTAPELSPLFAGSLARQVSQWFDEVPARVVEFGAGTGRLAAGLIEALQVRGTPAERYTIVELSADLRARQHETLARHVPGALSAVTWIERLPDAIEGVVIGNELLDAMPVRLFEIGARGVAEVGVAEAAHGAGAAPTSPAFTYAVRPADAAFAAAVEAALQRAGTAGLLEAGYRSELGEQASAWVATVAGVLSRGALLLIDYGFPAAEFYHPQRAGGTLACHYRHRVHGDPFHWPGLQDITAHVDFSAVADAAAGQGLELLGYTSQARFLVNCGLIDALAEATRAEASSNAARADPVAHARATGAVQTLLSEAEMGELFKAIAFGRGITQPSCGFVRGDRSATLARRASP
jgi:SAM-dependent MidA family methyltransferase